MSHYRTTTTHPDGREEHAVMLNLGTVMDALEGFLATIDDEGPVGFSVDLADDLGSFLLVAARHPRAHAASHDTEGRKTA